MKKKNLLIIGSNYGKNVVFSAAKKVNEINKIYLFNSRLNKKNLEKLILLKKIDVVFIAVPPNYQSRYISELIKIKKPFIVEKPIDTNYSKVLKIKNKIKILKKKPSIDLNFLPLKVFQIIKKKYLNHKIKDLLIYWNVPGKSSKTWKSNLKQGGGLLYNFGIHCLSLLNYFFMDLEIKNSEISKEYLRVNLFEKKRKIKIIILMKYNYNNINSFVLKINNSKSTIICENNSNNYHSGYKLYKYNIYKGTKKKVFYSKPIKNDRVEPVKIIIKNFIRYLNNFEKNKFSIDNGFELHELINLIEKKNVKI